jgi:hypothetical protein
MSLETVLFDDVELFTTGALRAALIARAEAYTDNVYVSNTSAKDPATGKPLDKGRQVTIRRDGGPRLDVAREQAAIGVNVWADTEQDVNDLARMVAALLWALPNGTDCVRVDLTSGPSVIPDDRPHRYLTADLIMRGVSSP